MKRKTPEVELQRLVLDWLAAEHIFAIRMQTGVLRNPAGRPVTFGVPGQSDILAFPELGKSPYAPVWIELKSPKGKQSDLQKSFQQKVEAEGHKYILARTLEDVQELLG